MSSGDEFDDHYATQRRRQVSAAPAKAASATETVQWVDDAEAPACHVCETPFSLVKRRHHCRTCGNVICSSCSVFVPTAKKPQRVCIACVEGVQPQRKAAAPSQPVAAPSTAKKEPRTKRGQADAASSTRPPPPVPIAPSSHRLQESIDNWFLDENEPVSPMAPMPVPGKAPRTSAPSSSAWSSVGPSSSKTAPPSNLRFADVVFDDRPLYDDDLDATRSLSRFPPPKTRPQYDNLQADRHVHRASVPSAQPASPPPQRANVAVVPSRVHEPAPPTMAAPLPAPVIPPLAPSTAPEKRKHGFRATMKRLFGGKEPSDTSALPPATIAPPPSTPAFASVSVSVSASVASSTSASDALSASKVSQSDESERGTVYSRGNDEASQSNAASAYANPSMLSMRPSSSSSSLVPRQASAPMTRPRRDTFDDMFEGPRHVQPLRDLQTRAFDIPSIEKPTTREARRGTLEDIVFGSPPKTAASSLYGAYASVPGASRYGPDRFAQPALPERSNRYAHAEPHGTTDVDFDLDNDDDAKRHEAEFDPVSGTYIVPQKALVVRQPVSEVARLPTAVGPPALSETTGIAIVDKLSSLEHELAELKSLLAARKSHRRSNAASIFEQESESDRDATPSPPIVKKKKRQPQAPRKDSFGDLFEDDQASGKPQYESLFAIQGRRGLQEDKDHDDDDEDDAPVSRWPGRHKPRRGRSPVPQVATKKASNRRFTMDDSDSASSPPRKPKRKDSFDNLFTEASPYKDELFGDNVASSDDDERAESRTANKRLQHIYGSDEDVSKVTEDDAALPSLKRKPKAPATALVETAPVQPAQVAKPVAEPRVRKDSIDNLFQDDTGKFDRLFEDKPRPVAMSKNLFDGSSDEDDVATPLAAPQPSAFGRIPSNVDNDDDEDDLPSLRAAKRSAPTPILAPAVVVAESLYSDEEELPSLRSRPSTAPVTTTLPVPTSAPLIDPPAQTRTLTDVPLPITRDGSLDKLDTMTALETVQIAPLVVDAAPLVVEAAPLIVETASTVVEAAPVVIEAAPTVAAFSLLPSQASGFVIDLDEEFDDGLFGAATVRVATPLTTPSTLEPTATATASEPTATTVPSMWLFDDDSGRSSTSSLTPVFTADKPQDEPSASLFDEASYVRVEAADVHSSPEMVGVADAAAVPALENTPADFESFYTSTEPPSSFVDSSMDDAAAVDGDDDPTPDADAFSFERKPTKKRPTVAAPVLVHRPSKPSGIDEDNDGGILLGHDTAPSADVGNAEPDDVDLAKVDNAEFDASWQAMQQDEKARKQNVLKRQRQLQKQKLKDAAEKKAAEKEKKPKASKKKHDRSTTK